MPAETSWYFLPVALVLGALHGLEPGHSKTMMAAFIVAIHGTVRQAVLLGLAATVSHTAIIWALAATALVFREELAAERAEPYLHLASGAIVLGLAGWVAWRTRRDQLERAPQPAAAAHPHAHPHDAEQEHLHHHADGHRHAHPHLHHHPHHPDQEHHHEQDHSQNPQDGHHHPSAATHHHGHHGSADDDAHTCAHAAQLRTRLAGRTTLGNGQILLFGLTGGLLPCPGALTVLLLCLQAGRAALGFGIVLAFSVGLAVTLVAVGAAAALGARAARGKWPQLERWAARAPYLSAGFLLCLGAYFFIEGLRDLA